MQKNLFNLQLYLLILMPWAIISGPLFSDLILILFGISFIINTIISKKYEFFYNKIFIIFLIWCIYILTISIFSSNILLSFQSTLFYFRFGLFFLGVIFILYHNNEGIYYFSISLFISFLFVILDAFVQYFTGFNLIGFEYSHPRLSGIFGEEKVLGSYITRILPFILAIIYLIKDKFKDNFLTDILFVLLLFLSGMITYLSGERTALFYYLIVFCITLIIKFNFRFYMIFFSFFAISSLFFIFNIYEVNKNRIFNETSRQIFDNSKYDFYNNEGEIIEYPIPGVSLFSIQHQALFISSAKIIEDHFVFGIGPKLFREVCKKDKYRVFNKRDPNSINGCNTHPHHSYIQIFLETGLFGFVFLVFIFISIIYLLTKNIYLSWRQNYNNILISKIYFLVCFFITVWPLVPSGNFFNNWLSIIYYLPLGFYLFVNSKKFKNSTTK